MDPYYYSGGPGAAAVGGFGTDYHYHPDRFTSSAAAAAHAAGAGAGAGATTMLSSPASDKARMGELAFLKTTLQGDSFFLPSDWEESVLGLILSGLRHGNSQVCLAALDCLLALLPQLRLYELTPHAKEACAALAELLGDSRPSVRERTQGALQLVAHKVGGGVTAVLEALEPAARNARSSTRMRQEAARCLGGLASSLIGMGTETEGTPELEPEDRRLLLESLATLATDQHPDVQAAGKAGVAKLLCGQQVDVEAVVQELGALAGDEGRWRALASAAAAAGYGQGAEGSVVEVEGPPVGSLPSTIPVAAAAAAMNVGAAVRQQRGGPPTTLGPSKEKEAVVTGAVEGVVEVVALPLHSEREVAEAMDAVAGGLLASEEQWQARVEALQRLQSIAVSGAGQPHFEALFIPAVKSLQEAITAQVCSLRSALSREGMATVAVLAQALGESFAPLADCWLPALLRMAQSNTLLTALSADQCLRCVVACTRQGFPRLLQPLLEGGAGALKNDVARMRCVNAVTLALWRWEEAAFERGGVDGVVRMIKAAVADKKDPVRAAARQCFWAFHRKFPSAAAHLLEHGLDAPRARMLRKEQSLHTSPAALEALVPARRYKVVAAAQQQQRQQQQERQQPAHPTSSSSKPAAAHPPSAPAAAAEASHQQHHHALASGAMRAAAPHAHAPAASTTTTTSGARRQSLGPFGLAPGSGPMRVAAAAAPPSAAGPPEGASSSSSGNKLPPAAPASHRGGSAAAQRVVSHREKPPTALPPRGGGGNSGGETSSGNSSGAEPTVGNKPVFGGGGGGGGRLSMSGPLRVVRQPPGGTTAHAAPVTSSSSSGSSKDTNSSSEARPPVAMEPAAEQAEQQPRVYPRNAAGWDGLLRAAESGHWAERLRCLEDVGARLRDFNAVAVADAEGDATMLEEQHAPGLARVVAALARHLHDGNARVAQAAMDGIGEALRLPTAGLGAAAVGPCLEQLLPRVLLRAVDPKEQVRATAMGALDGCTAGVEPSALCAALAKALHELAQGDKANAKALVLALDTLRTTIPRAGPAFFATAAPTTRGLLSRLAVLLGSGRRAAAPSASVERATVVCLQALQTTLDGPAFTHALSALAAEPQLAVRRALAAAGTLVPPAAAPHPHPHPHPVPAGPSGAEKTAGAPRPRPRSHSIGGGDVAQGPPSPPVGPVATAAPPRGVLPPNEPSRAMTPAGAASAAAVGAVGDENSAPPGVYHPSTAASSAANSGTKPEAQQARIPSSSTPPSGHTASLPPEIAVARALAILSDASAAVEMRSQALEALASALARGGPALWERHCGAALHLFLDGMKRWQQEQQGMEGRLPCALLQQVPTWGQEEQEEEEARLLGGGGNCANVWASAVKLPSATTKQHSQQQPRDRAAVASMHLSLRGLRYLVRLARRQAQQHAGTGFAFDAYLEVTAGRLLGCAATPDYAVFQSAERTLSLLLLAGVHPSRSFSFLVAAATAPGTPTPRLLMSLRALTKLLPRVPPQTATAALPSLCPLLVRAVADPEIVLRMTSVACIAALYLVVKDALLPHLHARLQPMHLKLVTIYIKRATAAAAHAQQGQGQQGEYGEEERGEEIMRARNVVSPPQQQQAVALRPALCEIVSNGR